MLTNERQGCGGQPTMMRQVSDWTVQGEEVRRYYRFTEDDGSNQILFEIHCTLSRGFSGIDMFVNFLLHPGQSDEWNLRIQQEATYASLSRSDDATPLLRSPPDSPEFFPVLACGGTDGSTVMNVFSQENVWKCFKLFSSGKNMTFRLLNSSKELIVRLPLPNDNGFRRAYDACHAHVEATAPENRAAKGALKIIKKLFFQQ
jgi:hypothetical protein